MNTGIISMLTDEELSIARQYLLHRLKKEAEWLLHCAEKPLISLVKDSGEKVKRIAELLYTIFIEEEIRKERIS